MKLTISAIAFAFICTQVVGQNSKEKEARVNVEQWLQKVGLGR